MIVNYDGRRYRLSIESVTIDQLMTIYSYGGEMTLAAMTAAVKYCQPDGLGAVYWLMLQQNGDETWIEDVEFKPVKFARAIQIASELEKERREHAEAATKRMLDTLHAADIMEWRRTVPDFRRRVDATAVMHDRHYVRLSKTPIADTRAQYLWGFGHYLNIPPQTVDGMRVFDFFNLCVGIDNHIENLKKQNQQNQSD